MPDHKFPRCSLIIPARDASSSPKTSSRRNIGFRPLILLGNKILQTLMQFERFYAVLVNHKF